MSTPVQGHVRRTRQLLLAALCSLLLCAAALALVGCAGSDGGSADGASSETTQQVSYGMAGAPQDVVVSQAAIESTPTPWTLATPEDAVRSYLDWTSYAYRVAQPDFAKPTMSDSEFVRVDAYNEYNLQKQRLIDQRIVSISFEEPTSGSARQSIATRETWAYRYVSISEAGKTIEGPYEAVYDVVYSLVATDDGWVVDSVTATAQGEVK